MLLDSISVENDLIDANINFNRAKIEQTDSGITRALTKTRKSVEGNAMRIEKDLEQRVLRLTLSFWKLMLKDEEGNNADARKMQKKSDMAGIKWNLACTRSEIKDEIEEAKEKQDKYIKRIKKKKEDEILDLQENKFDLEDEHDTKKGRKH